MRIKLFFLSALLFITAVNSGFAQYGRRGAQSRGIGIEITPFSGYLYGGSLLVRTGEIEIKDSESWGVALNFDLAFKRGAQFEVFWIVQNSEVVFKKAPTMVSETLFGLNTHYIQLGGLYPLGRGSGRVQPFGTLSFGTTLFHPQSIEYSDDWRFSATLGLGLKIFLTNHIGLRFQGRVLFPFYWGSGGFWCSSGGCSVGVGTTSVILQADLTAGLIIAL